MCGIFACYLNRPLNDKDIELGRCGTSMLAHRGPDGEGEWYDRESGIFLGHRRLAIVDLSAASDQPMTQNGLVITYNGELYNFPDVRRELIEKGHKFETTGDVEVVLKSWATWGERSLDKFDGMFAFAIKDEDHLHVATDPFGEKPLYMAQTDDGIYLSSEIAPLASLLGLKPDLDEATLTAYLSLGFIPPPATGYRQIQRIAAAQYLRITRGTIASRSTYWSCKIQAPSNGPVDPVPEEGLDKLRDILIESIERRLQADAPLCMFLSRGVDSALVAALASKECGASPQCLTVSYPDGTSVDEAPAARAIARHLELDHKVIPTTPESGNVTPDAVLDIYGQPCETVSSISIREMSKTAVDEGFKVALTGMGGDEFFFGYGKSSHFYDRRKLYGLPEPVRKLAGSLAKPFVEMDSRFRTMACDIGVADNQRYLARKNFPAIEGLRKLPGFLQLCESVFTSEDALEHWYLNYELNEVMPGLRLVTFDHSSMRSSLELRTPFLSRKLFDTVSKYDPASLIAFGQKSVLRRLLERYVPKEIMNYPKSGFVFPQDVYISKFGDHRPVIKGLPEEIQNAIWSSRFKGKGWSRMAIRLINLERFFQRSAGAS
jgi:asparagine synthase (glutamine-hydrolysing)